MHMVRMKKMSEDIQRKARIFNALSDPTRIQIVQALADGEERTGSEIAEEVGITLALLCHHSGTLRNAGILEKRKRGQCSYHSLNRDVLTDALKGLIERCEGQEATSG